MTSLSRIIVRCLTISLLVTILIPVFEQPGIGAEIEFDPDFLQEHFEDFTEEAGLAVSYLPVAPAEPLGFPHFDIGVEITTSRIDANAPHWQLAFDGNPPTYVPIPKLRARIGLPLGIDLGAIYSYIPVLRISVIGGELKWAIYKGGVIMPAVALRGTYTQLLGISELDLQTYGVDLSISKGFAMFTPYFGVGQVWILADIDSPTISIPLTSERQSKTRGFVGLQIGSPILSFVVEAAFSAVQSYSARLSLGFY